MTELSAGIFWLFMSAAAGAGAAFGTLLGYWLGHTQAALDRRAFRHRAKGANAFGLRPYHQVWKFDLYEVSTVDRRELCQLLERRFPAFGLNKEPDVNELQAHQWQEVQVPGCSRVWVRFNGSHFEATTAVDAL